ncbi:hypothetical protein Y032_0333g2792 [Ancylostoma ceylanicum]|nr:hypothetical protein Y032_0333g2792 [Ancylostoma ceylanicum]
MTCPSHPICEVLHCSLCVEKIYNTQCWTNLDILLIASTSFILLSFFWIFKPVIFLFKKTMKLLLRLLNFLFNFPRRNKRESKETNSSTTQLRTYTRHPRHHRSPRHPAVFIAVTILVYGAQRGNCCSDVISVVSATKSCSTINSTEICTFNEGATLTLQPLGQDVCLSLRNQKDEHIGLISLRVKSIHHICHQKIEFFTRDHELNSESSHRCYRAGSCQPDKCDNTKSSDTIPEFSWRASNNPGFTFCTASCQCLVCDGCFFCTPSCLFYRLYARATSNTIYTIFTCPVWELTVTAEVTLQLHTGSTTHAVTLRPGRTTRVNNIRLSLLGTISPQLPILTSAFITDGTKTAMTTRVQANVLTPQTPAQLQCASKADAITFLCQFSSRACSCSTGPYKATCTCPEGKMSKYLQQNTLPLVSKNVIIEKYDDTIAARTQVGSAINVQVNMENVKVASIQNQGTCTITASTVEGCYSCLVGAKITVVCYSTEEQTTADITCNKQHQIATCTKRGKLTELTFHFNSPEVSTSCSISCPGGQSSFHLSGLLDYVNDAQLQREIAVNSEMTIAQPSDTFTNVTHWISSFVNKFNLSNLKFLLVCCILALFSPCIVSMTSALRDNFRSAAKKQT